jgi:DNA-directed RNA polymerase subunit RPC12/RpoP
MTHQEDIWKCYKCGNEFGRHDQFFDGECEECHNRDSENLRSKVINQIETDIKNDDYSAIYELLQFVPTENLENYLSQ